MIFTKNKYKFYLLPHKVNLRLFMVDNEVFYIDKNCLFLIILF